MKTAWVFLHVAFEDLGVFQPILVQRGFALRMFEMGVDSLADLDPVAADLVVVLGGPIGAYEQYKYPFLQEEVAFLQKRLQAQRPTLGICLGAQLMAKALGGRVYAGHCKEIGWSPIQLSAVEEAPFLKPFHPHPVLHWHADAFEIPPGAVRLAASRLYPNQAFSAANHQILGIQFHPEVDPRTFERWLIGHGLELSQLAEFEVNTLRNHMRTHGTESVRRGTQFFEGWLAHVFGPTPVVE